jgi:glutamate/tyrosine decarboxylase-like PLP-dependent enzyme
MPRKLQKKMFHEMERKDIFRQAQKYAFGYADNVFERNVYPTPDAIANLGVFVEKLPESTGNAAEILEQLNKYGTAASVAQTGGRYFGFVTGGVIPVSLAVRWLSDFWDQNTALYVMSPIAAKLEQVAESWLKELLGLPEKVVAGFVSGSSLAIFCGLAAARYRIFHYKNWDINKNGFYGAPKIRVVAGDQVHGTVIKAIALLGFGVDNIEQIHRAGLFHPKFLNLMKAQY